MAAVVVASSCTKDLDDLDQSLYDLELRVTQLEVALQSARFDIKALQILAKAQDAAVKVVSVTPTDGGVIVTLSNNQSFTLLSGTNGTDGVNAKALSIAQDTDGIWYWTVGGEWMLDASGQKCIVNSSGITDGITPQIRANDGSWEVSLDGGKTWTVLCADRYAPSSIKITETEDSVSFKLGDGSEIVLGKVSPFLLSIATTDYKVEGGEVLEIPYTVKGVNGGYGMSIYFASEGYSASIDKAASIIKVAVPAGTKGGSVIVCAMKDDTGQVSAQSLSFTNK